MFLGIPEPGTGKKAMMNMVMSMAVNTAANAIDEDQFFLRVRLTSVRTMVSQWLECNLEPKEACLPF